MKTRFAVTFVFVLTILLSACNPTTSITLTPPGDPLAPTAKTSNPTMPTPTLQGDPLTPTPEVFNPLDPSPTPSESNLPLNCRVTDLKVQIERSAGYCYAYPPRFSFGKQPNFGYQAVIGPAVGSVDEPVFATFAVESGPYDPSLSLDQQADAFLRGFTAAAPETLTRARLTVGGEKAVMVENVPVQLSWRVVFVAHNDRLYRLMYWPVDVKEAISDLDDLYQTTMGSFSFISTTDMTLTPTQRAGSGPAVMVNVNGVAQSITAEGIAPVPSGSERAWWEPMPQHISVTLQGYPIANHELKPQVFVYPVEELGVNEAAVKTFAALQQLLRDRQPGKDLPFLPLYNSTQVMHAQVSYQDFKSGSGVRYLTQYAQGIVPINNYDLFYTYQGLTRDGQYYVAVVLPVNLASLATDDQWNGQELPVGSNYRPYVEGVVNTLNQHSSKAFTPDLSKLDEMIQSIEISK